MNCPFFKYIKKYFNSGILLMNLDKMRQEDFTAKAIEFVKKHSKELIYADQDVLNFLCIDKWLPLEKKWNLQVDRSQTRVKPDPIILHYTTGYKPWCRFYNNYYQRFYKHYLKKWPEYKIKETTTLIAAKQIIKFIPYSVPIQSG
jgi:lipopolysaccharide biosynthesis glycosyltransferase